MADKTSITNLPKVQGLSEDDLLIVQDSTSTNAIKFSDFILGPDNVNFYQTIATNESKINALTNQSISATDTIATLSAINPGQTGDKNIVYVKERSASAGYDTGGFFIFDYSSTTADNGGTVLDPTSAAVTGRWIRINYDHIDPRWFGASTSLSDNHSHLQAAIDYSTSTGVYKPVKIPNGTFNTKPISCTAGTHLMGSGTTKLQLVVGGTFPAQAAISDVGTCPLLYVNGDDVIIEDLEFIGLYNAGSFNSNIAVYDCDDVEIKNCRVQSASSNGIVLTNTQRCKVTNNLIYRSGGNGIAVHSYNEAAVSNSSGSMRNIVSNNISYDATLKDITESPFSGSDNPNYNVFTSNICDTTSKLLFTGTNSITGLNVINDTGTDAAQNVMEARFAAGVTATRGISGTTHADETYTITAGLITGIA